jgi:hypothetical protein
MEVHPKKIPIKINKRSTSSNLTQNKICDASKEATVRKI